jgi:hypothetical protein
MPSAIRATCAKRRSSPTFRISAIRAMMPPSPSLSARMMNATYLIETMIVTAQKTSEITP